MNSRKYKILVKSYVKPVESHSKKNTVYLKKKNMIKYQIVIKQY